jgi:hypothetical protein
MDSIASLNVKTSKREGVGARSLARTTLGVEGVLELHDGIRKNDKQSLVHKYLHKTRKQVG